MKQIKASVFILTFNSERDIERALASVQSFDDIVVVDSGSVDGTLALLAKQGISVWHRDWTGYVDQKAYAMSLCRHDWVFNLDSDEAADHALVSAIAKEVTSNRYAGMVVRVREHFLGRSNHVFTKHCAKLRVCRRSCASYEQVHVHEGLVVKGDVVDAKGFIHHYGERSVAIKMDKINQYSCLKVKDRSGSGLLWQVVCLVFVFPLAFIKSYILRRQCFNGRRGFIAAMMNGFYAFLKQAKRVERQLVVTE
jgi:glycosyltransferase involved in cell wall biosynthesis